MEWSSPRNPSPNPLKSSNPTETLMSMTFSSIGKRTNVRAAIIKNPDVPQALRDAAVLFLDDVTAKSVDGVELIINWRLGEGLGDCFLRIRPVPLEPDPAP